MTWTAGSECRTRSVKIGRSKCRTEGGWSPQWNGWPAGESRCEVILRLRNVLDTIRLHHSGRLVLIVPHQAAVLSMHYLTSGMTCAHPIRAGKSHSSRFPEDEVQRSDRAG